MTKLLLDSIKDGYSKSYLLLLEDYGRWSHFLGCRGYKGGHSKAPNFIDDQTAMIINKAMCELKASRPNLYKLWSMFYIADMDELDIVHVLRQDKQIREGRIKWNKQSKILGVKSYGIVKTIHHNKFSVDTADVLFLIEFASKLVLNKLQALVGLDNEKP